MIRKKKSAAGSDQDFNTTWSTAAGELRLVPMDKSGGFSVRPGIYELRGSMALRSGVNFTVHSAGATAVTLVLFHREEGSVLMETSTWSGPYNFWDMIDRTMRSGFRPVLAHPERYEYMGEKEYARLRGMGVRFQMNYPSMLGYYGEHVKEKAAMILKKGWYDMAGSDCHRVRAIKHQLTDKVLKKDAAEALRSILTV